MTEPYLSIVTIGRNDGRLPMMQTSVFGKITQLEKYKVPSEFILVDWNTPTDQDKLSDVMSWPSNLRYCTVRVIEVSPEIHHRFDKADKLPLYAAVASNVGFRRARGKFILLSSLDTFFSNELVEFFSRQELNERALYRIDRHDVTPGIPLNASLKKQLKYCRKNTYDSRTWLKKYPIHTAACGDFILLSRDVWHNIRGILEGPLWGIYLDGLACYMAVYYENCEQVVLEDPMRIYHIDHKKTWTRQLKRIKMGPDVKKTKRALEGISFITRKKYRKWRRAIIQGEHPVDINGEDWGLGNEELPIKCI